MTVVDCFLQLVPELLLWVHVRGSGWPVHHSYFLLSKVVDHHMLYEPWHYPVGRQTVAYSLSKLLNMRHSDLIDVVLDVQIYNKSYMWKEELSPKTQGKELLSLCLYE